MVPIQKAAGNRAAGALDAGPGCRWTLPSGVVRHVASQKAYRCGAPVERRTFSGVKAALANMSRV